MATMVILLVWVLAAIAVLLLIPDRKGMKRNNIYCTYPKDHEEHTEEMMADYEDDDCMEISSDIEIIEDVSQHKTQPIPLIGGGVAIEDLLMKMMLGQQEEHKTSQEQMINCMKEVGKEALKEANLLMGTNALRDTKTSCEQSPFSIFREISDPKSYNEETIQRGLPLKRWHSFGSDMGIMVNSDIGDTMSERFYDTLDVDWKTNELKFFQVPLCNSGKTTFDTNIYMPDMLIGNGQWPLFAFYTTLLEFIGEDATPGNVPGTNIKNFMSSGVLELIKGSKMISRVPVSQFLSMASYGDNRTFFLTSSTITVHQNEPINAVIYFPNGALKVVAPMKVRLSLIGLLVKDR